MKEIAELCIGVNVFVIKYFIYVKYYLVTGFGAVMKVFVVCGGWKLLRKEC